MADKIPAYQEYEDAVKKCFWKYWSSLSREEVDEYIRSEEAQNEIKSQYDSDIKAYKKGEIPLSVIMQGGVGGTAYCLSLMY